MLEQPCPTCGHVLDINEDVCPKCGLLRRRRLEQARRSSPWVWLLLAAIVGGALGLTIGQAVSLAAKGADSGAAYGLGALGSLGGVALTWMLTRQR